MDIQDFVVWWQHRDRAELEDMIRTLDHEVTTADGEFCRLRATALIGARIRRSGRSRVACTAGHRARQAVVDACERTGLLAADPSGSKRLARAAGDVARCLICAPDSEVLDELLRPFRPALDIAA